MSAQDKLRELGEAADPSRWDALKRLARLTALKRAPSGEFHLGHWWRGPLLYSLVKRLQPRHVLELGTGRGYGALCMAQAAVDAGIECTIWTIDIIPPDAPQSWAIDRGSGPRLEILSRHDVWGACIPRAVMDRIHGIGGDSARVMADWQPRGRPRVDLAFIDGDHDYWSAKHDFIASLRIANRGCTIVLDDYTNRRGYGITRLVDREAAPKLADGGLEIIDLLATDATVFGELAAHRMAVIRGEGIGEEPLRQFYTPGALRRFERTYAAVKAMRAMSATSRRLLRRPRRADRMSAMAAGRAS